jgi:hypothetical protein
MWNPQGSRKIRKAKEQLAEKHINSSWGKELEGTETYCQRHERMEGTCRQPMFLIERWTFFFFFFLLLLFLITWFLSSLVLLLLSQW